MLRTSLKGKHIKHYHQEFFQQFKKKTFFQRNNEIANLTDRLNQSVITITDLQNQIKELQKENRQLKKNTSSLLLTAKVEVERKQRDITALQQKYASVELY